MSEKKKLNLKIKLPKLSREKLLPLVKPSLALVAVCVTGALMLSGIYALTNGFAERSEAKKLEVAMQSVLPAEKYDFVDFDFEEANRISSMYSASDASGMLGYCVEVTEEGIGGEMRVVVGIDNDGRITKVTVMSSEESVSVGKQTEQESFLSQFVGKSGTLTAVKSDVRDDAKISIISGATVSSEAVCEAVNHALAAVTQLKAKEAAQG